MDLGIQEKLECSILNSLVYTIRLEKKNGNKIEVKQRQPFRQKACRCFFRQPLVS